MTALYDMVVVHRRHRPVRHWLRYRIVSLLLDLDELGCAARPRLRLFSIARFNLVSFWPCDHGIGGGDLRAYVDRQLHEAGLPRAANVQLLCMPRVFGFVFNPLSVFVCRDSDGAVTAVLYEVNNTFGQRHTYLLVNDGARWRQVGDGEQTIRQTCPKAFYVSPFMDMDLTYRFRVTPPGETVAIAIDVLDDKGIVLGAALAGRRETLSDLALLRAVFWRAPFLPLRVLAGIHWEAFKLWLKGMHLRTRPSPPSMPVSIWKAEASRIDERTEIEV